MLAALTTKLRGIESGLMSVHADLKNEERSDHGGMTAVGKLGGMPSDLVEQGGPTGLLETLNEDTQSSLLEEKLGTTFRMLQEVCTLKNRLDVRPQWVPKLMDLVYH